MGTEGAFTGIAALGTGVVLFKRDYLHEIYGTTPQNFTIPKQIGVGCVDARSVCEAAGSLFFLSRDGFYLYNGGTPNRISDKLGKTYTAAVSGCDGRKVYAYATAMDGEKELLVYDLERQNWYLQDAPEDTAGFLAYNGRFYMAAAGGMYDTDGGGACGSWYAVTKEFTEDTFEHKGAINVYFRYESEAGAWARVYRRRNREAFELCGSVARESGVLRVPVRIRKGDSYQFKIIGSGEVRISAMETVLSAGGRTER